jgi:hypothetical protein
MDAGRQRKFTVTNKDHWAWEMKWGTMEVKNYTKPHRACRHVVLTCCCSLSRIEDSRLQQHANSLTLSSLTTTGAGRDKNTLPAHTTHQWSFLLPCTSTSSHQTPIAIGDDKSCAPDNFLSPVPSSNFYLMTVPPIPAAIHQKHTTHNMKMHNSHHTKL